MSLNEPLFLAVLQAGLPGSFKTFKGNGRINPIPGHEEVSGLFFHVLEEALGCALSACLVPLGSTHCASCRKGGGEGIWGAGWAIPVPGESGQWDPCTGQVRGE